MTRDLWYQMLQQLIGCKSLKLVIFKKIIIIINLNFYNLNNLYEWFPLVLLTANPWASPDGWLWWVWVELLRALDRLLQVVQACEFKLSFSHSEFSCRDRSFENWTGPAGPTRYIGAVRSRSVGCKGSGCREHGQMLPVITETDEPAVCWYRPVQCWTGFSGPDQNPNPHHRPSSSTPLISSVVDRHCCPCLCSLLP